jgi:DNA-binding NtrC family response regulator
MEISDRRYKELLGSIGIRQGGSAHLGWATQTAAHRIVYERPGRPNMPTLVARQMKEILLVDPEAERLLAAQKALSVVANVSACSEFRAARTRLLTRPPDLLVTNLRLQEYNGLHLVHLAEGTHTRCIVYGTNYDPFLAQAVQAAGAFYEHSLRMPLALASYVNAVLPAHDRRDPSVLDRRGNLRGGRRCTER